MKLTCEDDRCDSGGKAHRHRIRNKLYIGAEAQETAGGQHQAGQDGGKHQSLDSDPCHRQCDQRDKGAGRPADLEPASPQQGDEKTADDGCIKAPFGRRARSDGDSHRKGQGHNGHRQPGQCIRPEVT